MLEVLRCRCMVLSRCNTPAAVVFRSIATEPFYARGMALLAYGQNPLAEREEYTYK